MITHRNIGPKNYTKFGVTHEPVEKLNTYHADIIPGQSIRIHGTFRNRANGPVTFDKTFVIGDWAEYDSYNLRYEGRITSIGKSTVTVQPDYKDRSKRLDLYTFCWRNWDFNLAETQRHNSNEMYYI